MNWLETLRLNGLAMSTQQEKANQAQIFHTPNPATEGSPVSIKKSPTNTTRLTSSTGNGDDSEAPLTVSGRGEYSPYSLGLRLPSHVRDSRQLPVPAKETLPQKRDLTQEVPSLPAVLGQREERVRREEGRTAENRCQEVCLSSAAKECLSSPPTRGTGRPFPGKCLHFLRWNEEGQWDV